MGRLKRQAENRGRKKVGGLGRRDASRASEWQTGCRVTYLPAALSSSEIEPVRFPSEEISVEILREEETKKFCFYPLLAS